MSAKSLQPGQLLTDGRRTFKFVRRFRAADLRFWNLLQCDDYVGLNGPEDQGLTEVNDWHLARRFHRAGKELR